MPVEPALIREMRDRRPWCIPRLPGLEQAGLEQGSHQLHQIAFLYWEYAMYSSTDLWKTNMKCLCINRFHNGSKITLKGKLIFIVLCSTCFHLCKCSLNVCRGFLLFLCTLCAPSDTGYFRNQGLEQMHWICLEKCRSVETDGPTERNSWKPRD